jgi:lipopolysaccharide assembly outer membrane protein LptD (OstA)
MTFIRRALWVWVVVFFAVTQNLSAADESVSPEPKKKDIPTIDSFAPKTAQVETVADSLEYSRDQKKVIAKGNVVIKYGNTQLTADYAEVETESKKAYAYGHVIVFQNGRESTKTDEIFYDFDTDVGSAPKVRHIVPPWYMRADDVQQRGRGVKVACQAGFSTCNMEEPYYELRAKKMTIYEHDRVVAQNVTLYIHKIPVFWLPYIVVPVDWFEVPVAASAGYYSRWGYYMLVQKRLKFTPEIGGKLYVDWRSKRGFASGFDMDYNYGARAQGLINTYLAFDDMAPDVNNQEPFSNTRYRNRGRISWRHRTEFDDYSYLLLRYNRLADEFFLQEFFQKEFRNEVEPQSFVTVTKNGERFGFFATAQKQMNRFEQIVEKLPQARFDWRDQPLLKIPGTDLESFYQGDFSGAAFNKVFGRQDSRHNAVNRFDSSHEFTLPMGWRDIRLTPVGNWEGTYYSRTLQKDGAEMRSIVRGGADLRTHAYKIYPWSLEKFGMEINQVRHVIEPSVNYLSTWSTLSTEKLTDFDHRDLIDSSNIVRLGLENRLQTKRVVRGRVQRVDFVSLNTYLSYQGNTSSKIKTGIFAPFDDGKSEATFTLWSQEVVLRPYNWLQYELRLDEDLRRNKVRAMTQDIKFYPAERMKVIFGHRLMDDFNTLTSVNQFVFDGTFTLNDLWDLGGYIRWNPKANSDNLEEWQVKATRRLACEWVLDFGYNVRNSDIQNNNHTLFFDFYLSPVPGLNLKTGPNRASFGPPVIGDTVAGANAAYDIGASASDSRGGMGFNRR